MTPAQVPEQPVAQRGEIGEMEKASEKIMTEKSHVKISFSTRTELEASRYP